MVSPLHVWHHVLTFFISVKLGLFPITDRLKNRVWDFVVQTRFSLSLVFVSLEANNNGIQIFRLYIPVLLLSFGPTWRSWGVCGVLILGIVNSWSRWLSSRDLVELYVVSKMVVSSRFGQQVSYFVLFSYRPSTHIVHDDSAVRWSTISLTTYWGSMFIRLFNTLKVIVYILYTMMEISHWAKVENLGGPDEGM